MPQSHAHRDIHREGSRSVPKVKGGRQGGLQGGMGLSGLLREDIHCVPEVKRDRMGWPMGGHGMREFEGVPVLQRQR
jgi:hypothetical protein